MFGVGEQVRLESDEKKAIELQEEHGGWNQKMRKVVLVVFTCLSVVGLLMQQ